MQNNRPEGEDHNKPKLPPKKNFSPRPLIFVAVAIMVFIIINSIIAFTSGSGTAKTVNYSDFIEALEKKQVSDVKIADGYIYFTVKSAETLAKEAAEQNGTQTAVPEATAVPPVILTWRSLSSTSLTGKSAVTYKTLYITDSKLVDRMIEAGADFHAEEDSKLGSILYIVFTVVLPMAIVVFLFVRLFGSFKKGEGGIGGFGFGKSNAKLFTMSEESKKFSDVAGQDEAKQQLEELVDLLHQPGKYKSIGAKLPKGALLVGPPGTGKTLLAQAVAGEANVPFFFVSGSAFVEMFVGAGAARVRDLFKQATEKAPCIIFIDEIDAIGKKRDTTGYAGNDEREQSLNQLLAEMDGFDAGKGIIVLGATNRPEILDNALLRPGRFDRRIAVELPDLNGREAILKVHAKNIQREPGTDLHEIARITAGASGADLANIVNEAALRAVREKHARVTQEDLEQSVETVIAGAERKSMVIPENEKKLVAYHEIGHALAAARQKNTAPVTKITIIPRSNGALGYTMQADEEEHVLLSRTELKERLITYCAGRAAEQIVFDNCTTGAANDIEQATKLAKAMVTRYGMSDQFGMMTLETQTSMYLGTDGHLTCAQDTAAIIDKEVQQILKDAYAKAIELLTQDRFKLDQLAAYLLEKETMTGDDFMRILNDPPFSEDEKSPAEDTAPVNSDNTDNSEPVS